MILRAKFEGGDAAEPAAKPPPKTVDDSVPPAARNLAMAHHLTRLIDQGLVADYSAAARMLGVSQPRLTHLMSLTLLAPQIQEAILAGKVTLPDKRLRRLARIASWADQLASLAS
jgi:hypothetical protein